MSKKATDIVAYITFIGWIIAFFAGDRENSKFHLNQALVIAIVEIILSILGRILTHGLLAWIVSILSIILFILWLIGLIRAIKGSEQPVPIIGGIQILP